MVDTRVWGVIGILLTFVGVATIGPEVLHSLAEGHMLVVAYGVAAVVAALLTLIIVGRGIASPA